MTDAELLARFFHAWRLPDRAERESVLAECLLTDAVYSDPNAPRLLHGIADIGEALGAFTALVPEFSAVLVEPVENHHGFLRCEAQFHDGQTHLRTGLFFARRDDAEGKLSMVAGFLGEEIM